MKRMVPLNFTAIRTPVDERKGLVTPSVYDALKQLRLRGQSRARVLKRLGEAGPYAGCEAYVINANQARWMNLSPKSVSERYVNRKKKKDSNS